MTDQLKEIGKRLEMLRESTELTSAQMAERISLSETDYTAYERGEQDFSFSFLHNAAEILGVDILDIMSGESPKLSTCCLVRKDEGFDVHRRTAYSYKHLAFTFRDKKADPFLVTVVPNGKVPDRNVHEGQEFVFMTEGQMELYINEIKYTLNEGDSVYFNAACPHAMKAVGGTAKFLSVVLKGDK